MVATRVDRELLDCLARASAGHRRLCPRQVLGARIGLHAGEFLGLDLPRQDKRLLAIVETDGCFLDGVAEATGCRAGRRTLRIMDHGKAAATFVDILDGRAVRIRPHPEARGRAPGYAPGSRDRWHAQLDGYARMPAGELLLAEAVTLTAPLAAVLGRPGVRVPCDQCGEEIINCREVTSDSRVRCRDCSGEAYFQPINGSRSSADQDAEGRFAGGGLTRMEMSPDVSDLAR